MLSLFADPPRSCSTIAVLCRVIENLPPVQYDALTYYERWVHAMLLLVVEKWLLSEAESREHVARQVDPCPPAPLSHI